MLVLLLALVTPSWAQNLCSVLNISCGNAGDSCDNYRSTTLLVNHTFAGCANNLVCVGRNWTCRTKPMVGTACEDDEDCQYRGQMEDLYCNKAGSTHVCAVPAEPNAPTDGCRANGDVCTMDSQCAWGACVSGWCQGLLAGANCSGVNANGCGWNLFCWQNTTDMNHNMCAMKKATGQPAVEHTWGWGYSCMTGFFRNDTGVPTCVSYDGWWGTRTAGQQCYYEDLDEWSHELCVNGYYCAEENSTCTMDRADKPNCTVNGFECYDKERDSNMGTCHCANNNQNPTCEHSNCGNAGARWATGFAAAGRCGATPQQTQGRCLSAPNYDENWNGSCTFRAGVCNPGKSYYECEGKFQLDQWKKVLFPTGKVCGMDINPGAMFWPSYCSSATLTQPLLVVVVGLMALLRL